MSANHKYKIYFLTSNKHKYKEVKEIIEKKEGNVEVCQLAVEFEEIRSDSPEEIVRHKVIEGYKKVKDKVRDGIVIAEDSGLFIDALNGFPGTYSAWVLKKIGIDGIIKLMEGVKNRNARYIAAIAIYIPKKDKIISVVEEVEGEIINEKRGEGGFGHDPIFLPKGNTKTFAEDEEYKSRVSHRSKAIRKVIQILDKELE